MGKRAKRERDIYCTICGRAYFEPVAAKNHVHRHRARAQRVLVMVAPQLVGTKEARQTSLIIPAGTAQPSAFSWRKRRRLRPPLRFRTKDIILRIRQVAAPPVIQSRMAKGKKGGRDLRPRSRKNLEPLEHGRQVRSRVHKHTKGEHDVPLNVSDRLSKKRAKIAKNKRRIPLDYSPIDDEGQFLPEDEADLTSEDRGQCEDEESSLYDEGESSSEDELPPSPEVEEEKSVWYDWHSVIEHLRPFL